MDEANHTNFLEPDEYIGIMNFRKLDEESKHYFFRMMELISKLQEAENDSQKNSVRKMEL